MCLQYKSCKNNVGKGDIARKEKFLLFSRCIVPVWRTFWHFHQISNYLLQTISVWRSLEFVILGRVKERINHFQKRFGKGMAIKYCTHSFSINVFKVILSFQHFTGYHTISNVLMTLFRELYENIVAKGENQHFLFFSRFIPCHWIFNITCIQTLPRKVMKVVSYSR